ncbi:hypothetical protein Tco_0617131 [Tanacetum coccineum]
MNCDQLYTDFNVGAARQIFLGSEVRSRAEHELELKEKLNAKYVARGKLLEKKDSEILRLKSQLAKKEAETMEVVRLRDQVSSLSEEKSALTAEVSALKVTITQKDHDISFLDSHATHLESSLAASEVRIYQKSQENRQKRANTDTRTEECARAGSQSQKSQPSVNSGQKVKKKAPTMVTIHHLSQNTTQSKAKGFSKLKGGKDNSMALVQDGRDKIVISRLLLVNQARKCHVDVRKHMKMIGFTLESLTQQAQMSLSRIATLAIRVSSFVIQGLKFILQ